MQKTTLYLPVDLHRGLKQAARREKRSVASLIREAVEKYLGAKGRPLPKSLGVGSDKNLSARDTEAWLRKEWEAL